MIFKVCQDELGHMTLYMSGLGAVRIQQINIEQEMQMISLCLNFLMFQ